MRTFDNESCIIELFQDVYPFEFVERIGCPIICQLALNNIVNKKTWSKWIDSSQKNAPPPDFFNNNKKIMMEVMRVDDHTHKNAKGKLINLTASKEKDVFKMLQKEYGEIFPENASVFINSPTGLPTNDDHRFTWYKDSFKRVIEEHSKKIEIYKTNHKGFRLIFFVFDESSAYSQPVNPAEINKTHSVGDSALVRPHLHYLDIDFVKTIKESGADILIWFAPYKKIDVGNGETYSLPCITVYDIKHIRCKSKIFAKYEGSSMISAET